MREDFSRKETMGNETVSRSRAASRPGLKAIDIILLVISAALVIVGTAVMWNIRSDLITIGFIPDNDAGRSRYNWDLIVFWLVWLSCAASVFLGTNRVLPVLAAGMLFILAMIRTGNNYASFGIVNYCRVLVCQCAPFLLPSFLLRCCCPVSARNEF